MSLPGEEILSRKAVIADGAEGLQAGLLLVERQQITDLLPLVLAVVVTDALQAVVGFGLIGLKRTMPSFVATFVCYGALAAVAAPVTAAGGLGALWTALALANLAQAVAKAHSFRRHSAFTENRDHDAAAVR